MKQDTAFLTNKEVANSGTLISIAAVFFYSILTMGYVIIRSSVMIFRMMPKEERAAILWANGFSVAYSIVVFSLLMAMVSAIAGASGSLILKKLLLYFNPAFNFRNAILISCMTALFLLTVIYSLLYAILKDRMTLKYAETFFFWFVFPAIIGFIVCIIGGIKLNSKFLSSKVQIKIRHYVLAPILFHLNTNIATAFDKVIISAIVSTGFICIVIFLLVPRIFLTESG